MITKYLINTLPRLENRLTDLHNTPYFYLVESNGENDWTFTEIDGKLFMEQGKQK